MRRWEDTDNVLQGVLMRIDRALSAIPIESARDYFRLANTHIRRELLDLLRKCRSLNENYQTPRPDTCGGPEQSAGEPTVTDDSAQIGFWESFHERAGSLPETTREVFGMIWYHDLPQAAVAEMLSVSTRTVKRHWQVARLRLMEELRGELPE